MEFIAEVAVAAGISEVAGLAGGAGLARGADVDGVVVAAGPKAGFAPGRGRCVNGGGASFVVFVAAWARETKPALGTSWRRGSLERN